MKWLIFIALLLFFSCEKPKKQENTQTPIVQKDSVKQTPEIAQKDTEALSGKQLLDSLLKKATYKNLKKIELPEILIRFDTLQNHKITEQEFVTLDLERFNIHTFNSHVYTYWNDFKNNHLFVILRQEGNGAIIADLWLLNSLGKCKAIQKNIAYNWGDMGFSWRSYTEKVNDSSFITHSKQFDHRNEPKQTLLYSKTHFFIQKDSFFVKKTDTLAYKKPKF